MSHTITVLAEGLAFPEGPVVMPDGSIIIVELGAGLITRCWGEGRTETVVEIGGGPNGAAIGPDGGLYICNCGGLDKEKPGHIDGPGCEGRIERVDLSTGKVERVYDSCDGRMLSAPNDLVFAKDGTIWFTDMGKRVDYKVDRSSLLAAKPDGSSITRIFDTAISYNGVGLSPDESTVYVADTFQSRIYTYDATNIGPQEPHFLTTVPGHVELDSLAMTASGDVCVGTLQEGGISQVTPTGEVTKPLSIDEVYVTNIAFGGEDMMDAYITCSTSGRLVHTRWHEPGLKLNFCNF